MARVTGKRGGTSASFLVSPEGSRTTWVDFLGTAKEYPYTEVDIDIEIYVKRVVRLRSRVTALERASGGRAVITKALARVYPSVATVNAERRPGQVSVKAEPPW
jgi:hypothetical protein